MQTSRPRALGLLALAIGLAALSYGASAAAPSALQATPVITVTGTPEGPQILVPDKVNVRLGPGVDYELVGVLIAGQQAPAIGRSAGGEWIQIVYQGVPGNVAWVYAPYVTLVNQGAGSLPIIEPPPTSTPRVTATIDPTLAAQFNLNVGVATRLPTFTPPGPLTQPTFAAETGTSERGIPPILAIAGLLVVGGFGLVISFLRGR